MTKRLLPTLDITPFLENDALELVLGFLNNYSLESVEHYLLLIPVRAVCRQFRRVIDERVIPQTTVLGEEVIHRLTLPMLESLRKLTRLGLCRNKRAIPSLLFKNPNLRALDIGRNGLITNEELSLLTNLTDLKCISPIGDEGLAPLRNLTKLDFFGYQLPGPTDATIGGLTNLLDLRLHYASITDKTFRPLTNLQSLRLTIVTNVTDAALLPLKNLTSLSCCYSLTDASITTLRESLLSLELGGNVFITSAAVGRLRNLTHLNINGHHHIGDSALRDLENLTSLDLTSNRVITDPSLERLTGLKRLILRDNHSIGNSGLIGLTSLEELDLGCSSLISDEAVSRLTNLTKLNLFANYTITCKSLSSLERLRFLTLNSDNRMALGPWMTRLEKLGVQTNGLARPIDEIRGLMKTSTCWQSGSFTYFTDIQ